MNKGNSDLSGYYRAQAGQKKYLDALVRLTNPTQYDVVLDIGTGSGTVSFFLGNRVQKITAIDPNRKFIEKNRSQISKMREAGDASQSSTINFEVMGAEDVEENFPTASFDTVICWGSVHHFRDCTKAMKGISRVCRPGGKLIIYDAFFPEAVREFWEMASTIHDPTTVRHRTYFEYMELLRQHDFIPETILPFRHRNILDTWLSTIDKKEDDVIAGGIKTIHPGKYDAWLGKAHQKGLKESLREEILGLSDMHKTYMSIRDGENGCEFTYDTFVLSAVRERRSR